MTAPTATIPATAGFQTADEVIVRLTDGAEFDGHGQIRFTAFWQTDDPSVPGGVRGQVFHASLDDFRIREARANRPVRVLNADGTEAKVRQVALCPTCRQPVAGLLAECARTPACVADSCALDHASDRSEDL